MKKWLLIFILIVLSLFVKLEADDIPFQVKEPYIMENFRNIYRLMDLHRHDNDGSARLYNIIPSSASTYDIGNTTRSWRRLYIDSIEFADGSVQTTSNASTYTYTLGSGGDVGVATTPFIAIPGAYATVGRSTWNITAIQAFNLSVSTFGSSFYRIALSTSNTRISSFTYISPQVEVSTGSSYSSYTSTSIVINSDFSIALHVMESSTTAGSSSAGEYGIKLEYWRR